MPGRLEPSLVAHGSTVQIYSTCTVQRRCRFCAQFANMQSLSSSIVGRSELLWTAPLGIVGPRQCFCSLFSIVSSQFRSGTTRLNVSRAEQEPERRSRDVGFLVGRALPRLRGTMRPPRRRLVARGRETPRA